MSRVDALADFVRGMMADPSLGMPTTRYYVGQFIAAEAADANLSQVYLPGGQVARFVPKLSSVGALSSGDTIALVSAAGAPTHIVGKLVGNITLASVPGSDSSPPTTPGGLGVSSTTTSSVSLSWSASTDNVGVVAYDVYVNNTYWLTVTGTTATATGLAASTTYSFAVQARDAAGNRSLSASVNGTTSSPSAPPAGSTYTLSYAAQWSRTYNYNGHSEYDSWFGSTCYQGQYGGGNLRSLIGFNWAQIQSDMSGATGFSGASIKLTYNHWYWNKGGTAIIGTHSNGSAPSSFVNTNTNRWQSGGWTAGLTRTVQMGSGVCQEFGNGTSTGIAIGPGLSSDLNYYGSAYGAGSGVYTPILTLTFVK